MKTSFAAFAALCWLFSAAPSFGQVVGNRLTWVSGVGDDQNPASRTAPALTFAGALAKTSANGQVAALDGGDFAPLAGDSAITQSVTIDGHEVPAGITATATDGIDIDGTTAAVVVTLRNLDLNGLGSGLAGIKVTGAATVHLERCRIHDFSGGGIDFQASSGSTLEMKDCQIDDCAGGGVLLRPANQAAVLVKLEQVRIGLCGAYGVGNGAGANTYLRKVEIKGTSGPAVASAAGTRMTISQSSMSFNSAGVLTLGTIFLTDSEVVANSGRGLGAGTGGGIYSTGTNRVVGNSPDGSASGILASK